RVVPETTLLVERQRTSFDGVHLEHAVEPAAFASSSEKGEQRMSDGAEEQQAVATVRAANVRRRQSHPEVHVFVVAKRFLDSEAPAVELSDFRSAEVGTARGEAPGVLHPLVV